MKNLELLICGKCGLVYFGDQSMVHSGEPGRLDDAHCPQVRCVRCGVQYAKTEEVIAEDR